MALNQQKAKEQIAAAEQLAAAARLAAVALNAPSLEEARTAVRKADAAAKEAGLSDAEIQGILAPIGRGCDAFLIGALARSQTRDG